MRNKYIPALVLTLVALFLLGNSLYANNIKNTKNIVSEERELDSFDRIELDGSADLKITVGETQKITVTGNQKYLDKIRTRIAGRDRLLITDTRYRSRKNALIEIQVPELTKLSVFGSGDVEVSGLDNEKFDLYIDGSGDVTLNGEVTEIEIAVDGSGDVDASDLTTETAYLEITGSGDVDIDADEVYQEFYGDDDVYFHGNSEVIIRDYDRNHRASYRRIVPGLLYVPDITAIPAIPAMPSLPAMPAIPSIPAIPEIHEIEFYDFDEADLLDLKELREKSKRRVWD